MPCAIRAASSRSSALPTREAEVYEGKAVAVVDLETRESHDRPYSTCSCRSKPRSQVVIPPDVCSRWDGGYLRMAVRGTLSGGRMRRRRKRAPKQWLWFTVAALVGLIAAAEVMRYL
jgi:hypothetical protein